MFDSLRKFKQKTGKTIGGVSQEYLSMVIDDEKGRELEIITHWKGILYFKSLELVIHVNVLFT